MYKQFNHIKDLENKDKVFPIDKNGYALFFSKDGRFFIYALYTKKDLSTPDVIEIDFESYMNIRSPEVVENYVQDIDHLIDIIFKIKQSAIIENLSVGQVLELAKKK